jgi:hypothetical protein
MSEARTHCPHGHPLTPDNLVASRLPKLVCRNCHLERMRRARRNKGRA